MRLLIKYMSLSNEFRIDFIGIGTSKSGTTWVSEILRKHPGIYYPVERKEVNYFNKFLAQDYSTLNNDHTRPYSWYNQFFKDAKVEQLTGEITPSYLSMPNAAKDIYNYNPHVKLFTVLRSPVERSFSEYLFSKQNGIGNYKDFNSAIKANPKKFLNASMYYKNLQLYYDLFPAENIKILFYEDMKDNNKTFLQQLYKFLKVDDFFPENFNVAINIGQQAKNQQLNNFIGKSKMLIHKKKLHFLLPVLKATGMLKAVKKLKESNLIERMEKEIIPPTVRKEVIEYFINDIEALENLIGRDLKQWKL